MNVIPRRFGNQEMDLRKSSPRDLSGIAVGVAVVILIVLRFDIKSFSWHPIVLQYIPVISRALESGSVTFNYVSEIEIAFAGFFGVCVLVFFNDVVRSVEAQLSRITAKRPDYAQAVDSLRTSSWVMIVMCALLFGAGMEIDVLHSLGIARFPGTVYSFIIISVLCSLALTMSLSRLVGLMLIARKQSSANTAD
jgi:hypothetical protein